MANPYGPYLNTAVEGRVLVVGDSNVVFPAAQLISASSGFPNAAQTALSLDFAAAVPGTGLRDLTEFETRLSLLNLADFDAVLVNLGANDILQEDATWASYTTGPPTFAQRVRDMLDALPGSVPIFWIGVPAGLPSPPFHALEILFVDYTIASFDTATGSTYNAYRGGLAQDSRLYYVAPDAHIGAITPKFLPPPDGVHYTPAAASALFNAVCGLIRAAL